MKVVVVAGIGVDDTLVSQYSQASTAFADYATSTQLAYWFNRLGRGDELLGPGDPNRIIELTRLAGVNSNSEPRTHTTTLRVFLEHLRSACGSIATFTWISDDFLKRQGCKGGDIPFWNPGTHNELASPAPIDKELVAEIASDCLASYRTKHSSVDIGKYLSVNQEQEILRHWHQLSVPYRSDSTRLEGL